MAYDMDDHDDACAHVLPPAAPVTEAQQVSAIERMARITHLREQSGETAYVLGELVGRFAQGMAAYGAPEQMVADLAHHYLDKLLPE